jgi:hypothetical protein
LYCTPDPIECTYDRCLDGVCTHPYKEIGAACGDPSDTDCDNPDSCDGGGICLINNEPDGTPCTDDGNACTDDICDTGLCDHPYWPEGHSCGDGSDTDCTDPDTCDGAGTCLDNHEPPDTPCGDPSDTPCDNPDTCDGDGTCLVNYEPNGTDCDDTLFCNGDDYCDTGICEHTGNPCGGPCDEEFDRCLCEAPEVEGVGNRYLRVAPRPEGSDVVQAIVITPDCGGAIGRYVGTPIAIDLDGDHVDDENVAWLIDDPLDAVFLTPPEWGELYVFGVDIVPDTTYIVQGDCGWAGSPAPSDPTYMTTPMFGDIGDLDELGNWMPPDGYVDFDDIAGVVSTFRNLPGAPPIFRVDLVGYGGPPAHCLVEQIIDFGDIATVVDGFRVLSYNFSTGCPEPCP